MRIEDVVSLYDNDKLEKAKEYFVKLLGPDYEVKLEYLIPELIILNAMVRLMMKSIKR